MAHVKNYEFRFVAFENGSNTSDWLDIEPKIMSIESHRFDSVVLDYIRTITKMYPTAYEIRVNEVGSFQTYYYATNGGIYVVKNQIKKELTKSC